MACGFDGNSDIFGIGIRLAYYAQLVAVWFSNYFYQAESQSLRVVNKIFLLALLVAGILYFFRAHQTHAVEAFLLLQIGIVTGLVGTTEATRYNAKYREVSAERLIARILIFALGAFFNVIFWWRGLDVMLPTPCGGTEDRSNTYAFYGWRVDLYGWPRVLMRILSILALTISAAKRISDDSGALLYGLRMREIRSNFITAVNNAQTKSGALLLKRQPKSPGNLGASKQQGGGTVGVAVQCPPQQPNGPAADLDLIERVRKAEDYMASVYSIYKLQAPKASKPSPRTRLRHFLPQPKAQKPRYYCTDQTSYISCFVRVLVSHLTNKPTLDMRAVLYYHFIATGNHQSWHFPHLINRMYTLGHKSGPSQHQPTWQELKLASDIHLSQIPCTQSMQVWAAQATAQLVFIALLIVQVELTIVWNHVNGLSSFLSLGQLIPFITGTGGLLKVLWAKGRELSTKDRRVGDWHRTQSEYEKAMAEYVRMRSANAGSAVRSQRVATA